jgi:DNA-binding GntR family transcriptional regulator
MSATNPVLAPIENRSLIETAYDLIRQDIINCKIEPGQRVGEVELAERYQTGRAAVRMALNRLAQEKLVVVIPREGYLIAPITLKDVHDLFGARILIEPGIARLAAQHARPEQIARLRELAKSAAPAGDHDGVARYLDDAKAFHVLVALAAGNEFVAGLVGDMFDRYQRMIHLSNYFEAGRGLDDEPDVSHADLVDAIEAGDPDRAERIMDNHVRGFRANILEVLTTSPSLLRVNLGR